MTQASTARNKDEFSARAEVLRSGSPSSIID